MSQRSSPGKISLLVFFFVFPPLLACSSGHVLNNPEIELKKIRVLRLLPESIELEAVLEVTNPNPVNGRFSGYNYQFDLDGQRVVTGESDHPFEILAQKSSMIVLPATVRFVDWSNLLTQDRFNRDLTLLLSGSLLVDSWLGSIPVPFSIQGTVNLSDLLKQKAREFLTRP